MRFEKQKNDEAFRSEEIEFGSVRTKGSLLGSRTLLASMLCSKYADVQIEGKESVYDGRKEALNELARSGASGVVFRNAASGDESAPVRFWRTSYAIKRGGSLMTILRFPTDSLIGFKTNRGTSLHIHPVYISCIYCMYTLCIYYAYVERYGRPSTGTLRDQANT